MIINIRAQAGSGKSTTVRRYGLTLTETARLHAHHRVIAREYGHVVILGDYKRYPHMSGCDGFKSNTQLCELVEAYADRGWHVVFESMLFSNTVGPQRRWHQQKRAQQVIHLDVSNTRSALQRQQRQHLIGTHNKPLQTQGGILTNQDITTTCARLKSEGIDVRTYTDVDSIVRHLQHTLTHTQPQQITQQQRWDMQQRFMTAVSTNTQRLQQKREDSLRKWMDFE